MCGIAGFVGVGDSSALSRMLEVIGHRGPDDRGKWSSPRRNLWLGHNRLSITDVEGGAQPMLSRDQNVCLTFNGEIYNHRELRKQLERRGHEFYSKNSDTEVLLNAYREWGADLVGHLNGMWAFAIFDQNKQVLFLSRDRFGKKPLYYSQKEASFIFASELTAMMEHPAIERVVDRDSLKKYFANGYVPAPHSIIRSVKKLEAGTNLFYKVDTRQLSTHRYWRFSFAPEDGKSQEYWQESLREKLFQSTQTRMQADVPVGVLLSGGIDSSSITSMAVNSTRNNTVNSYSIGFSDSSFDESAYSKEVSSIFGTNHTSTLLDEHNVLNIADEVVSRLDEPLADSSILPSYLVAKLAAQDVKVVLGGDGSDELFAGYDPFRVLNLAKIYSFATPKFIHNLAHKIIKSLPVSHGNMSLDFILDRTLTGLSYPKELWNPVWLGSTEPRRLESFLGESIDPNQVYSDAVDSWKHCESDNIYDQTMQFYIEQYLQNGILTKIDRAAMMNSLEVRSPFLDIDFVNVVRKIPTAFKYRRGQTKFILKKALNPVLPLDILYRKKKGFGVPIGRRFKEGSIGADIRFDGGYYDKDVLQQIFSNHQTGRENNRTFLWAFWVFERWRKKWGVSLD